MTYEHDISFDHENYGFWSYDYDKAIPAGVLGLQECKLRVSYGKMSKSAPKGLC